MIDEIAKAIDGLLTNFTWRRLTAVLFVSFYLALVLAAYEAFTGHFRLNRIQQATDIAAKLQEIESKGFSPDSNLSRLHADLVRQLQETAILKTASIPSLKPLWKFLAAMAPWLLFTAAFVFQRLFRRGLYTFSVNPLAVMLGLGALALIAAVTALFIPTFLWPWGNLVIYPMLTFALFVVCIVALHYQKELFPKSA